MTIAWVILGVVALQQTLFIAFHASGGQIVMVQIIVSIALVAVCEVYHRLDRTRS